MSAYNRGTVEVICTECRFSTVIYRSDERLPGEVVTEHGRETGHKLKISPEP